MGINLLDMVKQQVMGSVAEKAASLLGESPAATSKALSAALPAVLGGVANQCTTISGAENLLKMFSGGQHDGSILDSVGSLLGGGSATQGLMSAGSSIVSSLFGNKVGGITDFLASHAGIKSSSASSLMSLAAPLIMGSIGKQMGGGSSVSSLMSLLSSQVPNIAAALPAGMGSVLGLSNLNLSTPPLMDKVKAMEQQVVQEASGFNFSKILPWLLLGLGALLAFYFFRSCNSKPEVPMVTAPVEAPKMEVPKVVVKDKKILKLPNGDIEVETGTFLDKLYDEVTDNTLDPTKGFAFDHLNFATGSATISEDSKGQLNDLAKIMMAFPKVGISVDGHTDNVGDAAANLKLSKERALAVEKYLIAKGVADARILPEGLGSTKPVGDNTTEAGRLANRRTEVLVTKK